ncbi:mechanosensitive ion channel, partial [Francisellaceae bacterium]|nr:mechanosensitive ion channel [Francisellaceae bacterium]
IKQGLKSISTEKIYQNFIIEKWYVIFFIFVSYLFFYLVIYFGLRHPPKKTNIPDQYILQMPLRKLLYFRLNVVGAYVFVYALIYASLLYSNVSDVIIHLLQSISVVFVSAMLVWVSWLIKRLVKKPVSFIILFSIIMFFLVVICIAVSGYYVIIQYILQSILLTIFGLLAIFTYTRVQEKITTSLNDQKYFWQKKLRYYFDIRDEKTIPELAVLKLTMFITIWILYIGFLVSVWGWKTVYPDRYFDALVQGFEVVRIQLEPLQIFIAIIVFVVLSLFGRFISGSIARKSRRQERDLQVAFASITGYVSFMVAIFIALLVSGVNFTGLAIIAGALSVGIGLGLQDIVNNFVSGVILLLEKPIKPGDRIIVGDTEGFVKRVRVRSTRITTMSRADVIVPNADLIKNQVTNYMFRDPYWRVECKVGVAYGSDTELVKQTLLEVAQNHQNVVQDEANGPAVLFKQFGDSALNFELWCIIKNVNSKYVVESELNFAIDKAFREKRITIAFPQRDVHIYQQNNNNPAAPEDDNA